MSSPVDFDRTLSAWLDELAPQREPEGLTYAVLARTRRTRRIPGWATLERWFPMQTTYKFGAVPRTVIILVTLALLTAFTAAAIALGASPGPLKPPPPTEPAKNGLIAFDSNGDIWVVDAAGNGRQQLTSGPDTEINPMWSPDGTHIAYWSQQIPDGVTALKVMDAHGGDVQTLAAGLTLSRADTIPAWSHDSKSLAYSDVLVKGLVRVNRINLVKLAGGPPVELVSPGQDHYLVDRRHPHRLPGRRASQGRHVSAAQSCHHRHRRNGPANDRPAPCRQRVVCLLVPAVEPRWYPHRIPGRTKFQPRDLRRGRRRERYRDDR